jgi:inhibitor of KinA sporulation pathway (predicted exonuclease)
VAGTAQFILRHMPMRIKTDFICILDLEATCTDVVAKPGEPRLISEIIEIGAVMLSLPDLKAIDEFQIFVKPCQSHQLTDFCTSLTSITQADVDKANGFAVAHECLRIWVAKYSEELVLFASQGIFDYKQFLKDCAYHCLPFPFRGDHLNLKELVPKKMGWGKKGCGQQKMLNRLGIKVEGTPHRAISDARMAAKILQKIGYAGEDGVWYRPTAHEVLKGYQ